MYTRYYCKQLEKAGKFTLRIWPQHCIIGSEGHNIFSDIQEAITKWEGYWKEKDIMKKATLIRKGMNKRTEMYSAVQAEVPDKADSSTCLNGDLLEQINSADKLVVCGQALSHCVNYTVRDIVKYWLKDTSCIHILKDGSSNVEGFEEAGRKFLNDMRMQGVTISTCDDVWSEHQPILRLSRSSSNSQRNISNI